MDKYENLLLKLNKWYEDNKDNQIANNVKKIIENFDLSKIEQLIKIVKKCIEYNIQDVLLNEANIFKFYLTDNRLDFILYKYHHENYDLRVVFSNDKQLSMSFVVFINDDFQANNSHFQKFTEYRFTPSTVNDTDKYDFVFLLIKDDIESLNKNIDNATDILFNVIQERIKR